MMATRTYNPEKLPAHLFAAYKRFGGLTKAEIDVLYANGPVAAAQPKVNVDHILYAFATAQKNGLRQPKMHVDGFTFKLATRHAGVIYVTEDTSGFDEYMGKIKDGEFIPSPKVTPAVRAKILEAAADPLRAAQEFGKRFGRCSMCGIKLTNPESIVRSMGPICARNFGFNI